MTETYPWEWEGEYTCPDCGDTFEFRREEGWGEIAWEGTWKLQVYHDHSEQAVGVWSAAIFKDVSRKRKPGIVKDIRAQHSAAYKRKQEARRVKNAEA